MLKVGDQGAIPWKLALPFAGLEMGISTDQWTEGPEHWEMAGPHP